MPFIPHTEDDVRAMLASIGAADIETLFDEIPQALRSDELAGVPAQINEMEITRLMHERARLDEPLLCFTGAGAYDHHIPAAVWELTTRGEFYSAYTPYQAEASQGTLQLVYEYQSMICALTAMDVSNASLYDGASALAEAVLMAVRGNRRSRSRRVLLPRTVHPLYRKVVRTIVGNQGIELVEVDYDRATGRLAEDAFAAWAGEDVTAVVLPQPNYFGALEPVAALTDWAHAQGALVIAVVNPVALAVLEPPGHWGAKGADIACGDGQPLGIPLSSGGPYFGFMTCRQPLVRQVPGRIVGRTGDLDGPDGYTLTLQPREQHIRRARATSNICTNQGLMVRAATIHMSLLGAEGLERVAAVSHARTVELDRRLATVPGVERAFRGPYFHELVLRLPVAADTVLEQLAAAGIQGGVALAGDYPELGEALLVCATEKRTEADIAALQAALTDAVAGTAQPRGRSSC